MTTTTLHTQVTTEHETGREAQGRQRDISIDLDSITKAIAKRSFCTLATVSAAGWPHVAGVLYEAVGTTLYVNTFTTTRKARNVATSQQAGVVIPIRRLPVGPPSSVQFQATAEILDVDDPHIVRLLDAGHLKSLTGHGELDLPDDCFLRIQPTRRINTYGLGMPLRQLIRNPLDASGHVELPQI